MSETLPPAVDAAPAPHRRRPRYGGKNPRRFEDKYKEHAGDAATLAKVVAAGKTPAGTHRPIMVAEVLAVLKPGPGDVAADCTLGYGGHAREILASISPGGTLLGLDADPIELPKTEARLRALAPGETTFTAHRSNFAGLPQVLASRQLSGADLILADLGVSSMQLDDPARGFSTKADGPLDMRMNPQRGQPASTLLHQIKPDALCAMLAAFADEPQAAKLGPALAGKDFASTRQLGEAVRAALPRVGRDEVELSVRRVFQALRIAVNDEFSALETFLRNLPLCLNPGGRVAILTFHSGEDRRVKKSFEMNLAAGIYADIAREVVRATPAEQFSNPRSASAKLRWAKRA
jgi:16S rRNA (cytosine1402-N4)-methyltransferase